MYLPSVGFCLLFGRWVLALLNKSPRLLPRLITLVRERGMTVRTPLGLQHYVMVVHGWSVYGVLCACVIVSTAGSLFTLFTRSYIRVELVLMPVCTCVNMYSCIYGILTAVKKAHQRECGRLRILSLRYRQRCSCSRVDLGSFYALVHAVYLR